MRGDGWTEILAVCGEGWAKITNSAREEGWAEILTVRNERGG